MSGTPHPDAARVAREVAARYGVRVASDIRVSVVPRGVSGLPLPIWKDGQWFSGRTKAERDASDRRAQARVRRLARAVDPAIAARRARVAELHAARWSCGLIALQAGVSEATVRNDLRVLDLAPHPAAAMPSETAREAAGAPRAANAAGPVLLSAPAPKASPKAAGLAALTAALVAGIARGLDRAGLAAAMGVTPQKLGHVSAASGVALPPPSARREGVSAEKIAAVDALLRRGLSRADVAAQTGFTLRLINSAARASGHHLSPCGESLSVVEARLSARRAEVARLRGAQYTTRRIAAALGVCIATVTDDLTALGLSEPRAARLARLAGTRVQVIAMAREGAGRSDLVAASGHSFDVIRRILTEAGVPVPVRVIGVAKVERKVRAEAPSRLPGITEAVLARRAEVKRMRLAGRRVMDIAADLGVKTSVIDNDVKALGLTASREGVPARRAAVRALRAEGRSGREIAAALRQPESNIFADMRWLARQGAE